MTKSTRMTKRIIHISHPNATPHPFKGGTLCGKLVRFGGLEIEGERYPTCKVCLKIQQKICPTCKGTGTKPNTELGEE